MKQTSLASLIIMFSLVGIVISQSAYIVDQTEQAVVTQFGEPIGDPITEPGLHWKLPVAHKVTKFEKRILEWDGDASEEIPTSGKKFIWVDATGRWRISNALKFFQTMGDVPKAQSRIDDAIDGATKNIIRQHKLSEIVRSTNKVLESSQGEEDLETIKVDVDEIEVGRDAITRKILERARARLEEFGIELVDLRVKRINYNAKVRSKVFERMISERKRAAEQLRSEGQGLRAEIEGRKEKELKRITSEAYKEAQKLKGKADAEATQIYGEAYGKDPDFYAYLATLEKYPDTLKDGRLVLTTDSDFLKYLKKAE